jgi:hypothetical protein
MLVDLSEELLAKKLAYLNRIVYIITRIRMLLELNQRCNCFECVLTF